MGRVQDQVAVVTGAAHGLGRAIAMRLAEEGARLALGDVDGPALEKTVAGIQQGGKAFGLVGDVTDEALGGEAHRGSGGAPWRAPGHPR